MNLWQERQAEKKQIMEDNLHARRSRGAKEQLAILDSRLGKGVGAKKERARLARSLEEVKGKK